MKWRHLLTKWWLIGILVIGIGTYLATINDAPLYHHTVAKVIATQSQDNQLQKDAFNNQEKTGIQMLELKILNGQDAGQCMAAKNTFSQSNAQDLKYRTGQQVLVQIHKQDHHSRVQIVDLKRDTTLAMTLLLMVGVLIFVSGKFGIRPILSLILNSILFFVAIKVDIISDADDTVLLFTGVAAIFLVVTAFMLFGWTKKSAVIIVSAAVGLSLAFIIEMVVLKATGGKGLKFEMMNFVTQSRMPLYLSCSLLGVLGAVVDIASDVTVSLFALGGANIHLSRFDIFQSACQLSRSVVGPLTNVLFLIFITSTMPMMLLFLRNGNSIGYSVSMIMSLGIFQTLASAVGIALTGPIAGYFTGFALRKGA